MSMASVPHVIEGYRAVTAADLPLGSTRCVDVDGVGVIVARGQDGQYYAVERLCSHAALPLDGGRVRGASIVCPHHGARFELKSGRVLGPPAYAPIAAFPTRERDGQVEVWLYS
jgi:3-phenylpropionate/trans-cinnamate dioxygenase ferredoxin subunit